MPLSPLYRAFNPDLGRVVSVDENEVFPPPPGQMVASLDAAPPATLAEAPVAPQETEDQKMFKRLRQQFDADAAASARDYNGNRVTREDLDASRERQGVNSLIGGLSSAAAKVGNYRGQSVASGVPDFADDMNKQDAEYIENRQKLAAGDLAKVQKSNAALAELPGAQARTEVARLDAQKRSAEMADDAESRDANSPRSQEFRTILEGMGVPVPKTASAYTIGKTEFGKLVIEKWNKEQDRKAQLERVTAEEAGRNSRNDADNRSREGISAGDRSSRERIATLGADTRTAVAGAKGQGNARVEAGKLRAQYQSDPVIKNSTQLQVLNNQLADLAKNPTGASDQALITLFTKSLDPTSVVRESEFAMSANNSGVVNKYNQYFDKLQSGRELTPTQRAEMVNVANTISRGLLAEAQRKRQFYSDLANEAGAEPWTVVGHDPASNAQAATPSSQIVGDAPAPGTRRVYDPNTYGRTQTGSR